MLKSPGQNSFDSFPIELKGKAPIINDHAGFIVFQRGEVHLHCYLRNGTDCLCGYRWNEQM